MPGAVGIEAEYVADFAVVQAVEIAVAQTVLYEVTVVLAGAQWSCLRARAQGAALVFESAPLSCKQKSAPVQHKLCALIGRVMEILL